MSRRIDGTAQLRDNLCVSLPIIGHPLLEAGSSVRAEYIGVLQAVVERFAIEKQWAKCAIEAYAKRLGAEFPATVAQIDLSASVRRLTAKRFSFRQLRLNMLRHYLIGDILFLTAFDSRANAQAVAEYLRGMLRKRHRGEMEELLSCLYDGAVATRRFDSAQSLIDCWRRNKAFTKLKPKRILVTATMSAGKSTMINAMFGVDVLKTGNEACTKHIQHVFNKPFADGLINWNDDCVAIYSETFKCERVCFIDTPGVNSARHPTHRQITQDEIKRGRYDVIAYVINARYNCVKDDDAHLRFVLDNKPTAVPIVFVLNQLDAYKGDDYDSISESVKSLRDWLSGFGIQEPTICPLSASAGRLARKASNGENLDHDHNEKMWFEAYMKHFATSKTDLSTFYGQVDKTVALPLLWQSGLTCLEETLIQA
jgi:GTPase SAR1 family protein